MDIEEIAEKYRSDFGTQEDAEALHKFLIDAGYPSLAKMMDIHLPAWDEANHDQRVRILKKICII